MNEENAKKLLFEIADVAEDVGIPFMLYGGTVLGAVRDGRFVAVDQDVDFACLLEDFVPIHRELVNAFDAAGMEPELIDHRHDRPWSGLPYGIKIHKYGEKADFFGWQRIGERRFCVSHLGSYCLIHNASVFEYLKPILFYGRKFNVPMYHNAFLTAKYGMDWDVPHKEHYNVSKPTCRKEVRDGSDFWWV